MLFRGGLERAIRVFFIIIVGLLVYPVGYFVLEDSQDIPKTSWANGPYNGVGAYVINLDRSKERYEYIRQSIDELKLETQRISGVDGNLLSDAEIASKVNLAAYKKYMGHIPKKGTIGCSLSHIKVWQNFLASNQEYAVVFEDDISFNPAQLSAAIEEMARYKEAWDIIAFEMSHNGTPLTLRKLTDNKKLSVYLTEISHTGAYMLNRHAAMELLKKALPIKMPIDHYYTRAWEFDLKFTGIENPRLVHQTLGTSDIAKSNSLKHDPVSIMDTIRKASYKLQSYTIRFLYNLGCYFSNKGFASSSTNKDDTA